MILIRVILSIVVFSVFSLSVVAEHRVPEIISVELQFKPDVVNGERVYAVCESCHLPDGWVTVTEYIHSLRDSMPKY